MAEALGPVAVAAALFSATNLDDIVILLAFFADSHFRARQVVAGQYLGILLLTAASLAAAMATLAVPRAWLGLLGVFPILLGVRKLLELRQQHDTPDERVATASPPAQRRSPVLAVAGVTVANGGDNIGVYVPVFTVAGTAGMTVYVIVFLIGVAIWCAASGLLATRPLIARTLSRWGHIILPVVLIGVGLTILIEGDVFGLRGTWP